MATFRLDDGSIWTEGTALPRFRLTTQTPAKTATYALVAADTGTAIPCDASGGAFSVTVPSGPTLGEGFAAEIWNTGASNNVTVDGPGGTNITLSPSEAASIRVVDGVVRGAEAAWQAL